jgi:hypothetical protein
MKSPFPGMDPFIEACGLWGGFHNHLIHEIFRSLAKALPQGYFADVAVRKYVVITYPEEKKRPPKAAKPDEPVEMQAFVAEEFEEPFLEIYFNGDERVLVTCIEVLSPGNKRPNTEGWKVYQRKRRAFLAGQANYIEIDLLREGGRMPMITPWFDSPYALLVGRMGDDGYCRAWPAHFRRPLPAIPVPLSCDDPDLTLDLQPTLDRIYSYGRYGQTLDYSRPLTPSLAEEDAAWVREALKDRSR